MPHQWREDEFYTCPVQRSGVPKRRSTDRDWTHLRQQAFDLAIVCAITGVLVFGFLYVATGGPR